MTTAHIGRPTTRVDGREKVTGTARYAADYRIPNLLYGHVVSSAVAHGRIASIHAGAALELPGVAAVLTHENIERLPEADRRYDDDIAPPGSPFRPLVDDKIRFSLQPIAVVLAESLELAAYAASLVRIEYETQPAATDLAKESARARAPQERDGMAPPKPRGDADAAWSAAAIRHEAFYEAAAEHHNPMECFATTVERHADGRLTVYDKTQGAQNVQRYLASIFGYSDDGLRVVSTFVGGAFGSGLRPKYPVFLAVLAARHLRQSVRIALTRDQMFTLGHRPATRQRVALGASRDGRLNAVIHEVVAETSQYEDYSEIVTTWSALLYQCPNVRCRHEVVPLDVATPCDMRAPGAVWGLFALESAMDELAVESALDPLELRLRNYADRDQLEDRPFSSKQLRECYRQGADRFGWSARNPQPRSMQRGEELIGWGMAGGVWEAMQQQATATAVLSKDGKLSVASATADIGTGTYTIMTQIAAERLGLPLQDVTFRLGDSTLPQAPVEGGSFTAATVGSAVAAACGDLQRQLLRHARRLPDSPLHRATVDEVEFTDGRIQLRADKVRSVGLMEVLQSIDGESLEATVSAKPSKRRSKASCYAHSAIFAEVVVDELLGTIRVRRLVTAVAAGRIINPVTARSQLLGGMVWGIGSVLHERTAIDPQSGRIVNHNLADYHMAVHADIGELEVIFINEEDDIVNPLGVKGIGEIGVVGVAAAVANAVFHATGKRIRSLPITLDKLQEPSRLKT